MIVEDKFQRIYIFWSFFLQTVLILHFAVRKILFESYTLKYGWIVYALCVPALIISVILLLNKQPWYFWLGGVLYTIFAIYGYYIDYKLGIPWRNPIIPRIMFPYVTLYLASIMFYWWPLARIERRLWLVYTGLFILSTILNVVSH